MKATGIVRRVDDLGRIVIPKEIRRTLRIREGNLSQTTLTALDLFCIGIHSFTQRITAERNSLRCLRCCFGFIHQGYRKYSVFYESRIPNIRLLALFQ